MKMHRINVEIRDAKTDEVLRINSVLSHTETLRDLARNETVVRTVFAEPITMGAGEVALVEQSITLGSI